MAVSRFRALPHGMVEGGELTRVTLGKPWVCAFLSRTGVRTQASFATKHQGRNFAEPHARAFTSTGMPLKWLEMVDASVLTTALGEYQVTRDTQDGEHPQHPAR